MATNNRAMTVRKKGIRPFATRDDVGVAMKGMVELRHAVPNPRESGAPLHPYHALSVKPWAMHVKHDRPLQGSRVGSW
jgi:hypothetical protein